MKIVPLSLLFCCSIGGSCMLFAQEDAHTASDPPIYNSLIRVRTDNGYYKGRILEMTDSSITLLRLKEKDRILLPATTIGVIKVRRRFFKTVLIDMSIGAFVTGFVIVAYYWDHGFWTPDDPPFGQALLVGMTAGAGGGALYGMTESAFFRIRIPVNNSLEMFRKQRSKLLKYWAD